jgi:hypothetical protein
MVRRVTLLLVVSGFVLIAFWLIAGKLLFHQTIDRGDAESELPQPDDFVVDIEVTPISRDRLRFALTPFHLTRQEIERVEPWFRRFVVWNPPPPPTKSASIPEADLMVTWKSGRRLKVRFESGHLFYTGQRHYIVAVPLEEARYLYRWCEAARAGQRHDGQTRTQD